MNNRKKHSSKLEHTKKKNQVTELKKKISDTEIETLNLALHAIELATEALDRSLETLINILEKADPTTQYEVRKIIENFLDSIQASAKEARLSIKPLPNNTKEKFTV